MHNARDGWIFVKNRPSKLPQREEVCKRNKKKELRHQWLRGGPAKNRKITWAAASRARLYEIRVSLVSTERQAVSTTNRRRLISDSDHESRPGRRPQLCRITNQDPTTGDYEVRAAERRPLSTDRRDYWPPEYQTRDYRLPGTGDMPIPQHRLPLPQPLFTTATPPRHRLTTTATPRHRRTTTHTIPSSA